MEETIENLIKENQRLKEENELMKKELQKRGIIFLRPDEYLDNQEKIKVFKSYFRGREDIYAYRYFNKSKQQFSWATKCGNQFKDGCRLGKQKKACSNCPIAKFMPLTDEILSAHFKGKEKNIGIGIYPLLRDNTCYFLAMDFDDDHWFEDLYSVYQTALKFQLYPVMERSASGEGGHLWFFFEVAVPAVKARKLGEFLLQETMKDNHHISFESFDRMFPNQDYLPKEGFGNLIALPLRFSALKKDNSVFINEMQQVIPHQIEYLASRPKIGLTSLNDILQSHYDEEYFLDDQNLRLSLYTDEIYSKELYGEESSLLKLEKKYMNNCTYMILKRLSSMYNPEYYHKQRMRMPIYRETTPRILSLFEEDDCFVYLPRGIKDKIKAVLSNTVLNLNSQICTGNPIEVAFKGKLRDNQMDAVNVLLKYDMGVLKAVPGFGKTVIGIYIISKLKVSTLIIVPSKQIQEQWLDRIQEFLEVPETKLKKDRFVCKFNGSSKRMNGNIDIAIAASLANIENLEGNLKDYGLVLVDECHHAASNTFTYCLRHIRAKYIYGLSATPKRKDGLDKIMHMFCGPIRYETSKSQMQNTYTFQQILIPRITTFSTLKEVSYAELCNELINDSARNYLIIKDIMNELQESRKLIVLSERKEHLNVLYEMLKYVSHNVYILTGDMKAKDRESIIQMLNGLDDEDQFIILATSKLLGEGFDLPALKTLFLVMPISDENRITQYTGRIHRNYEGKDIVKVYDYVDISIAMAQAMYYKRLKQYQKEGYFVREDKKDIKVDQILFENKEYKQILWKDIKNAKKEIVIFATQIHMSKINEYYDLLQEKYHEGTSIHFILKEKLKVKKEELAYIEGMGADIRFMEHNKHFILIDYLVWNMNFDIFGKISSDGFGIRVKNAELVSEIKNRMSTIEKKKSFEENALF